MSHSNLTRWIEDADAREFGKAAMSGCNLTISETQHLHLGEAITRLPSWFRLNVGRASLALIGCQALAYIRWPQGRNHH
jgi:hypothetical protein